MIQLKRRHFTPHQKRRYFAIWLGRHGAAMLLTTTPSAQLAQRLVMVIRELDGDAFYSTERGPIVPLGRKP